MRHSNKLAILFGTVIAVMVILALILAISWGKNTALMPDNTPAGTVQRFLIALQQKDNAQAAKYLSSSFDNNNTPKSISGGPAIPNLSSVYYYSDTNWKATLRDVSIIGETASVDVAFEMSTSVQPFGSQVYSNYVTYKLALHGAIWLITGDGFSIQ